MAAMKKAVLRRKIGEELPKATPIPNSTGKATMTKLPYTTGKTAAKNASKGVTNRTVKTPSTISGATRPTGTATKKTGVANSKTPTMSSYAGGAVSGGLGSKVSRPLTSSKMRANPRPTNPKAVTQHMASKSKKYTY